VSVELLILAMFVTVFAIRLGGLLLRDLAIPVLLERSLQFVPVAMIAALVVANLRGQAEQEPSRLIAAIGAGLIILYTRQMWACIIGGFALYWAIRLLHG
jgi:branched-subunit amino acid transport protein